MNFWVKPNYLIKKLFPNYIWAIPNKENKVFLTFDDGPAPEITEWVLEQLKSYNAKATFFCVGENVEKHPEIFKKIISEGHGIGNHTYNHLNGWKTTPEKYLTNIEKCAAICLEHSRDTQSPNDFPSTAKENPEENLTRNLKPETPLLFRPPYGKLKPSQSKIVRKMGFKIVMWDILTRDYHPNVTPEECLQNVLKNVSSGSIVIFHDSLKSRKNLEYALPATLKFLNQKGYICSAIE
ncbi:MAG: polysaccharide deacetylase family protein [Flavobacterium sp.]